MDSVALESVSKVFLHRPALFNWMGRERSGQTTALQNVTVRVRARQVLVLLGPNGSGKTTLLKLLSTMLLPDSGQVLVEGKNTQQDADAVRAVVGFAVASDRSFFPRMTARENLDVFAALENVPRSTRPERIEEVLATVRLTDAGDTLAMKFSSGMFQRLGLARALLKKPRVLLLDEPTRSLDPGGALRLWRLVRETAANGSTIVLATHSFDEAVSVGDSLAILRRGELLLQHQDVRQTSVAELRSLYFREVGDGDGGSE